MCLLFPVRLQVEEFLLSNKNDFERTCDTRSCRRFCTFSQFLLHKLESETPDSKSTLIS